MNKEKPCIKIVNENLRLVEEGKPLNKSLCFLSKSCEFKKRYNILMEIKYGMPENIKAKRKEYLQKPEVKAKKKEYYQKPEVKARKKEYSRIRYLKLKEKQK